MNPATRACIAYIAGRAIGGRAAPHVFDCAAQRHVMLYGEVSAARVRVYDLARGCHVEGALPMLYDFGRNAQLLLRTEGNTFRGFDYKDAVAFSGSVAGGSVMLFDRGEKKMYWYLL